MPSTGITWQTRVSDVDIDNVLFKDQWNVVLWFSYLTELYIYDPPSRTMIKTDFWNLWSLIYDKMTVRNHRFTAVEEKGQRSLIRKGSIHKHKDGIEYELLDRPLNDALDSTLQKNTLKMKMFLQIAAGLNPGQGTNFLQETCFIQFLPLAVAGANPCIQQVPEVLWSTLGYTQGEGTKCIQKDQGSSRLVSLLHN